MACVRVCGLVEIYKVSISTNGRRYTKYLSDYSQSFTWSIIVRNTYTARQTTKKIHRAITCGVEASNIRWCRYTLCKLYVIGIKSYIINNVIKWRCMYRKITLIPCKKCKLLKILFETISFSFKDTSYIGIPRTN